MLRTCWPVPLPLPGFPGVAALGPGVHLVAIKLGQARLGRGLGILVGGLRERNKMFPDLRFNMICCPPWPPEPSRPPAQWARDSSRRGPGKSGWRTRGERRETGPDSGDTVNILYQEESHLKQKIGTKKREEDNSRAAKEDDLEHGEQKPGNQKTSEEGTV